jgi:hypothetical protein
MVGFNENIIYGLIIAAFISSMNKIIDSCSSLPFFVLRFFGLILFTINNPDILITISKKIEFSSMKNDQDEPLGIIFGFWYIGYMYEEPRKILFLCTYKRLEELKSKTKIVEKIESIKNCIINLYVRFGNYNYLYYRKRELTYKCDFEVNNKQNDIITTVIEKYTKSGTSICLINGESGTGKSTIGFLLAEKLHGSLCQTYSPTTPGDNLDLLYSIVEPTKENPLIILIDEVDIIFNKITQDSSVQHKSIPIEVNDKITWNRLLDHIQVGIYPNLILVLTSNLTHSELCSKYDDSFIRQGRVDSFHNLNEKTIRSTSKKEN